MNPKQTYDDKFKTESISRYINYLYRQGVGFLADHYKAYNIGAGQYQFLVYLFMKDGITHEELTEKIGVDKAATTRSIAKLEELGYISRVKDEKDKRKYYIYLTDYAKENKDDIINISRKWENELIKDLTHEELEQLYHLFRKMSGHALQGDFNDETL